MSNVNPGPSQTRSISEPGLSTNQASTMKFPFDVLIHVLYGKKANEPVDATTLRQTDRPKTYCDICRANRPPNGCPLHATQRSADQDDQDLSYAIKSFPPEVQLCTSSIPGARYGVCAKRLIPEGTWIGPYEGKRVKPEDLVSNRDNSFIWEIYEGDQASCYIDGSDENTSSWMRFIRCARCKQEQNLYAFQYQGNVFYRSFKEILPTTEMLVWYDEKYPQHMGIPVGLQEIEFVNAVDIENNNTPTSMTSQASLDQQKRDHHLSMMKRVLPSMRSIQTDHAPRHTIISSHDSYHRPIVPLDDLARIPASDYGTNMSQVPVNISAGIPSTARIPGRLQTGIRGIVTGDQEGPNVLSTYRYGNNRMTLPHVPANPESILTEMRSYPEAHAHHASHPVMSTRPHVHSGIPTSSCPNVTVVSANSDVIASSQQDREPRLYHNEISEEALKERNYTVKDDGRRTRSLRKRQSPSRIGVYISYDEEDDSIIDKRARLPSNEQQQQQHSDVLDDTKSNCSDSNSSNMSTKEIVGSAADEISMWKCRQCQKTFTQRVQLQVHICPNEPFKPYRCGQCEVSFDTAPELRSHVDTHSSEKPFKCGFCSRSFAGATTLNNHIRAHMGKKPFHCECGKTFAQPVQLARHQKTAGECEHYVKIQDKAGL